MNSKLLQFKFNSLRTKFIVICLLLLAIPSLIIGTIGYQISKYQLDQAGRTQLKNDVRLVISMIDALNTEVQSGHMTLADAQELVKREMLGPKDATGHRPVNPRYDLGKYGYLFAYDDKGVMVAHPDPAVEGHDQTQKRDKVGKDFVGEIVATGKNGGGFVNFTWYYLTDPNSFAPKIVYVEMDPHWHWIITAGSYMTDYNSGANQVLYLLLITLGISLIVGMTIVWLFAKRVVTPITKMADQAELVASGDLRIEPLTVKNKDEIGSLSQNFNTMIHILKNLISEIRLSTEQVAASAEELTASSEQTSKATEQVAVITEEVATGSEKQMNSVHQSVKSIAELSSEVKEIAENAQTVSDTALHASETASEGGQSIQTAIKQMNSIHQTVNGLAGVIAELGERSKHIGNIVEVITGISSQTNLLALNAAIEAARAGEHGKGFAVVADEVRKLAEESSQSAAKISEYISLIQADTNKAVESMNISIKEVSSGIEAVNTAGVSFEQIQKSIHEVAVQIEKVSDASKHITAVTESVVNTIEEISQVSETASAGAQNISAATEEQLASMQEITASAASLSRMAEQLQGLIEKFNA